MEAAITSVVTGTFLTAPTQAGGGSTGTKAFASTLFEPTSPAHAGGGSSGTKCLALNLLEPTSPAHTGVAFTLTKPPLSRMLQEPKAPHVALSKFLSQLTLTSRGVSLNKVSSRVLDQYTTKHFVTAFLSTLTLTKSNFTGTNALSTTLFETAAREVKRMYWVTPNIVVDYSSSQRIFDAIQALYLSPNGAPAIGRLQPGLQPYTGPRSRRMKPSAPLRSLSSKTSFWQTRISAFLKSPSPRTARCARVGSREAGISSP